MDKDTPAYRTPIEKIEAWDADAVADLRAARDSLRKINEGDDGVMGIHSRELSLAITKIEEAMLWQATARSGLDYVIRITEPPNVRN